MKDSVLFSHIMEEYGKHEKEEEEEVEQAADGEKTKAVKKEKSDKKDNLMQTEERLTGSVTGSVYKRYFQFSGGFYKLPVILLLLTAYQGASGMWSTLYLE